MKKYTGVREIVKGMIYEVNFRPYKRANRVYKRVRVSSKQEASNKRAELMFEYRKKIGVIDTSSQDVTFDSLRSLLLIDLKGQAKKTISRYLNTFDTFLINI